MTGQYGRPIDNGDVPRGDRLGGAILYRTAGSEGVVDVLACSRCGCMVVEAEWDRHVDWHASFVEIVAVDSAALAALADRAVVDAVDDALTEDDDR